MRPKIPSAITKITLNTPTFHNAVIEPALINFFYGKNGTGKSTIAQAIKDKAGIEWEPGKTADDYTILLYNQEFINTNIRSYGNMPGVFTISEDNGDVKEKIDAERERQRNAEAQRREFTEIKGKKETELQNMEAAFQQTCWNVTKTVRDRYPEALKGTGVSRSKEKLVEELIAVDVPAEFDEQAFSKKYATAFDSTAVSYPLFTPVKGVSLPTCDLLAQPITSSSDTDFSRFMKALKATDWVRQGHEQFHSTPDGKCPYCQQKMPDTFEADFAMCFDAQYQESIDTLTAFRESYRNAAGVIWKQFDRNVEITNPKIDVTEYKALLGQLESRIKMNLSVISDKSKEPASCVTLESLDDIVEHMNAIIAEFNKQIQENNDVVSAKKDTQKECKDSLWAHMAFLMEGEIEKYKESKKTLKNEIWSAGCKADAGRDSAKASRDEIKRLNLQYSNTQAAADSINLLLRNSGFQGFRIQEKEGVPNAYEVVRDNNEPARNMSEGEKNFIAFLKYEFTTYFDSLLTNRAMDYAFIRGRTVREMYEPGPYISKLSESCLSNHLGFNGFVEFSDGKIIFIYDDIRMNKDDLPVGYYCYDVMHEDNNYVPYAIKESVTVNHMGLIISNQPIKLDEDGYRFISKTKREWRKTGEVMTFREYMAAFPPSASEI